MSKPDPESITALLREQALQLADEQAEAPIDRLLAVQRSRKRMRRVSGLFIAVLLAGGVWWQGPGRPDGKLEVRVEGQASSATGGQSTESASVDPASEGLVDVDLELKQFAQWVSDRSGVDAQVITVEDHAGESRRAIYVPEQIVPVSFEHLSPEEQHAVTAILNEPMFF